MTDEQIKLLKDQLHEVFSQEILEIKNEISGIKNEISKINGEISKIKDEISKINGQISGINGELQNLNEKYDSLDKNLTDFKLEQFKLDQEIKRELRRAIEINEKEHQEIKNLIWNNKDNIQEMKIAIKGAVDIATSNQKKILEMTTS